jgi:hypothetical protein
MIHEKRPLDTAAPIKTQLLAGLKAELPIAVGVVPFGMIYGVLDLSLGNERLLAGLLAVGAAWYTRNVLWTIGVGMAILWLVQYFFIGIQ